MASAADNRRGILAMLLSVMAFVGSDVLVRLAAATLPTGEIMALRGVLATGFVFAAALATGAIADAPRVLRSPLIILRGVIEGTIAVLFIAALPLLPFAVLTATLLASSLIATGIAAALGMESVGIRRWTALVVGFVGVLVVLRPNPAHVTPAILLALASMLLVGVRDIVTRRIRSGAPTALIALASTLIVTIFGLLLGLIEPGWRRPTGTEAGYLAGAAVAVAFGNFMIVAAFRASDVAVVAPFRYTSLLFATVAGVLIWGEKPDLWTLIGSTMIVGSGLYAFWREQVRAREARKRGHE